MIKKAIFTILLCLLIAGCSRENRAAQDHHGFMKGRWVPMKMPPHKQSELTLPEHARPLAENSNVTLEG